MRSLLTISLVLAGCAHAPVEARATTPLAGRHIVFVAGFLNELIPGYFTDTVAVSEELGASTKVLRPPSRLSMDDWSFLVRTELDQALATRPRVMLVGHSMGGAAVVLAALERPELVLDGRIEAVVSIQGALGGSPLADSLSPFAPKSLGGIASLKPEEVAALFARRRAELEARLSPEQRRAFYSKVFYVRGAHDEKKVPLELKATHAALDKHGYNDGLLLPDDQKLDEGIDLGVIDTDHASLTVSGVLSTSTRAERRAFTTDLFHAVGEHLGWAALP